MLLSYTSLCAQQAVSVFFPLLWSKQMETRRCFSLDYALRWWQDVASAIILISPQAGSQRFPAATATKILHETISGCFELGGEGKRRVTTDLRETKRENAAGRIQTVLLWFPKWSHGRVSARIFIKCATCASSHLVPAAVAAAVTSDAIRDGLHCLWCKKNGMGPFLPDI